MSDEYDTMKDITSGSSIYVGREQILLKAFVNWLISLIGNIDIDPYTTNQLVNRFIEEIYGKLIEWADKEPWKE